MPRRAPIISVTLPSTLVKLCNAKAKQYHMTRSELLRVALREYFELHETKRAIAVYRRELDHATLKTLKGSIADL